MTYTVSGVMLNPTHSLTTSHQFVVPFYCLSSNGRQAFSITCLMTWKSLL